MSTTYAHGYVCLIVKQEARHAESGGSTGSHNAVLAADRAKRSESETIDKRMERDWKRSALGKKRRVAFSLT